jgi:hypothetical protein
VELPELDTAWLSAAFERQARSACPELLPDAMRLLDRLEPARWPLEWQLPWWLGHELGLAPAVARELVLGNLLGLAAIRLRDDTADGELEPAAVGAAGVLSDALYGAALDVYRGLFAPDAPIWTEVERRMAEWRGSSGDSAGLASRGAPLKISAFAVCLLCGRIDGWPRLEACLDHALSAMVLHDHLADWPADLAAGRPNAFVAATSIGPQSVERRDQQRTEVLAAMMARDAVASHARQVQAALDAACQIATGLGLPTLADGRAGIAARLDEHATQLDDHYRQLGDRAVTLVFGGIGKRGLESHVKEASAT